MEERRDTGLVAAAAADGATRKVIHAGDDGSDDVYEVCEAGVG